MQNIPEITNAIIKFYTTFFGLTGNNLTVADTDAHTGTWVMLEVISTTAEINAIVIDGAADTGLATTFDMGAIIRGRITSIDLVSGVVRMYGGNAQF